MSLQCMWAIQYGSYMNYECQNKSFPLVCAQINQGKKDGKLSQVAHMLDLCSYFRLTAFSLFFPTHCSILAEPGSLPGAEMGP